MQSSLGYSIFCPSTNNINNVQPKSNYIKKNKRLNKQTNKKQDPYSFTTFVESFNNKVREGHKNNKQNNKPHDQKRLDKTDQDNSDDEYQYSSDESDKTSTDSHDSHDSHDRHDSHDSHDDPFRNRIEGFTDNNDGDELQDFVADDVNKKTTDNNMPYPYYIPYYDQMSGSNNKSNTLLLNKLDYLIQLLEQQKQYKTEGTTEEIVLYLFLGIFIIYVIDSFARAGKYTR